jgi:hypothetical protein
MARREPICEAVEARLASGEPLDDGHRVHLHACARCADAERALSALEEAGRDLARVRTPGPAEVEALISSLRGRRAGSRRWVYALVGAAAAAAIAVLALRTGDAPPPAEPGTLFGVMQEVEDIVAPRARSQGESAKAETWIDEAEGGQGTALAELLPESYRWLWSVLEGRAL